MKREDILRIATESGFAVYPPLENYSWVVGVKMLERAFSLVAAAARAEEREQCALICEAKKPEWNAAVTDIVLGECASAIRSRSDESTTGADRSDGPGGAGGTGIPQVFVNGVELPLELFLRSAE